MKNVPKQFSGYCAKCKKIQNITGPEFKTIKGKGNSRRESILGKCSECGTKISKILANENKQSLPEKIESAKINDNEDKPDIPVSGTVKMDKGELDGFFK
jgi:hypothetical protein